jgi:hypothetical protein
MNEQKFHSMLTEYGKSVARNVYNGGEAVKLTQMAVGYGIEDTGNGGYDLSPEQADLKNEWYRFELNSLSADPDNPAWLIAEGIIKEDIGGHWINEISIIDNTGGVIALCTWPPTYKSTLPEGSSSASIIRVIIEVNDTNNFELVIDTSVALVTRDEFLNAVDGITDNVVDNIRDWATEHFQPKGDVVPADLISGDENNAQRTGSDGKLFVPFGSGGGTPPPPTSGLIYGARWFKNESPTTLTRLHAAVGLNFVPAVNGAGGYSDFDNQPIYRDIRLCNVINGGEVTAYYGEPGFSRNPGSGDVMVEIPKFYYKIIDNIDTRDYLISDTQHDNTWKVSPRHAPTATNPNGWDKIYVSAYTLNSNYRSVSGNQSMVSITRGTARTNINNRGNNYVQFDFATQKTIELLYKIEVANLDSQRAVGQGNVSGNSAQLNTGGTDNILFHSGSTVNNGITTGLVKYRHMENLWGNIYVFVDGININERRAKISLIPAHYADDTDTNYSELSYTNANVSGEYIKALGFDANYPFAECPTAGGGADETFIPDRYYSSNGWRVLCVGGNWSNTSLAGLFYFNAYYDSTSASTYLGCRLLVLP